MLFDVELHCDKWKGCKTKWCNGDGGFWCNEDCKLLQVRPITRKRKVEKILSNSDAVYVLYADGTWRKKMFEDIERIIVETEEGEEIATIINDDKID